MRILWDEPKRVANLARHGLDFATAEDAFDWTGAIYQPSYPGRRSEQRIKAIGHLGDALVAVVFAPLGREAASLISMRPASRNERRLYDDAR